MVRRIADELQKVVQNRNSQQTNRANHAGEVR